MNHTSLRNVVLDLPVALGDRQRGRAFGSPGALSRPARLLLLMVGLTIGTWAPAAGAMPTAIPFSGTVSLTSPSDEAVFTLDLGTLPNRAELIIQAVAPASLNQRIEIETTNRQIADRVKCTRVETLLPAAVGPRELRIPFHIGCYTFPPPGEPVWTDFTGDTLDVVVRAPVSTPESYPIFVDLEIEAITIVPSGSISVAVPPPIQRTLVFNASKDTTIYELDPAASNGAGNTLWVGIDALDFFLETNDVRSLLAFDFTGPELFRVPPAAVIEDASLTLTVLNAGGSGITIERIAADSGLKAATWEEGDADPGNAFAGEISSLPAADWVSRDGGSLFWEIKEGGDPSGDVLVSTPDISLGSNVFSSPAFTQAIVDMHASGDDEDGFVLSPIQDPFASRFDTGTRILSRAFSDTGPRLEITYTTQSIDSQDTGETINTDLRSFIGEGDDFRWVYDLDDDNLLFTSIGGVCTTARPFFKDEVPYTYSYNGDPNFQGIDCCLWTVDSPQTETVGTGQALFYHNLDPLNRANAPPDADGDKIFDGCDNCPNIPNGPGLGTCQSGASWGQTCLSDLECSNQDCSMSQQDDDFDGVGNACPEPSTTTALAAGLLALRGLAGRRTRPGKTSA